MNDYSQMKTTISTVMNVFNYQKYLKTEKHYAPKSHKPEDVEVFEFAPPALKPLNSIKKKAMTSIKGVSSPTLFHRALTKMGFGATPETISYIQSLAGATEQDKLNAYIDEQLSPDTIVDTYVDTSLLSGYQTLNKTRMQLYQQHYRRPDEAEIPWEFHILPGRETFYASFLKATQSKKQVFEVMADFWHNHFNVYMDGDGIPPMFVQYDRDVIRANALGNFRQMLEEVTKSTCMLDYLGNAFNEQNAPNENFARELLELHTISAKNYLGHMPWQDVPTDAQGRRVGYVLMLLKWLALSQAGPIAEQIGGIIKMAMSLLVNFCIAMIGTIKMTKESWVRRLVLMPIIH